MALTLAALHGLNLSVLFALGAVVAFALAIWQATLGRTVPFILLIVAAVILLWAAFGG